MPTNTGTSDTNVIESSSPNADLSSCCALDPAPIVVAKYPSLGPKANHEPHGIFDNDGLGRKEHSDAFQQLLLYGSSHVLRAAVGSVHVSSRGYNTLEILTYSEVRLNDLTCVPQDIEVFGLSRECGHRRTTS